MGPSLHKIQCYEEYCSGTPRVGGSGVVGVVSGHVCKGQRINTCIFSNIWGSMDTIKLLDSVASTFIPITVCFHWPCVICLFVYLFFKDTV